METEQTRLVAKLKTAIYEYEVVLHDVMDNLIDCGAVEETKAISKTYVLNTAKKIHSCLRRTERSLRASW